mgnify:CR=1 FL=1
MSEAKERPERCANKLQQVGWFVHTAISRGLLKPLQDIRDRALIRRLRSILNSYSGRPDKSILSGLEFDKTPDCLLEGETRRLPRKPQQEDESDDREDMYMEV